MTKSGMGAYVSHICGNKYTSAQLELLLENVQYQNRNSEPIHNLKLVTHA